MQRTTVFTEAARTALLNWIDNRKREENIPEKKEYPDQKEEMPCQDTH